MLARITAIIVGDSNHNPQSVLINPDQISDVVNSEPGLRIKMASGTEYEVQELDWLKSAFKEFPVIHRIYDQLEARLIDQWADDMYERNGGSYDYPDVYY